MKRKIMAIGAVLAWVCGVFGATHEGVQLWENGPLWAKTNIGANSPSCARPAVCVIFLFILILPL